MINFMENIKKLRKWLKENNYDGFVLPVSDEYLSEYQAPQHKRLEWLCGFDGSAGTLIITQDKAVLFTDGRYTLQAANQLDASIFNVINYAQTKITDYLSEILPQGSIIAFDGWLHSAKQIETWQKSLPHKLQHISTNPIDELWHDRPIPAPSKIFLHEEKLAGVSHIEKITQACAKMQAEYLLINEADAICWLLNIRGSDIPYNPLPHARALLHESGAVQLFIDLQKVQGLHLENVEFVAEDGLLDTLRSVKSVQFCSANTPYFLQDFLQQNQVAITQFPNPITALKAIKNATEIAGIKKAHQEDGLAMQKFINWFEAQTDAITELDVVAKLEEFRRENPHYQGASFATIAGSGANSAIVHYRATEATNRKIAHDDVLLLDSGGQYPYGTTDVTRTLLRGEPTNKFKQHFTYVLKGHIALAQAIFPAGTTGHQLDILARQYLWQNGLDYAHGTGHGVGYYLCVHEGPQSISTRANDVALQAGMVISNEPGYYAEGKYGIRIESLVLVVEKMRSDGLQYLGFETLTKVPINEKLVDFTIMSEAEVAWLHDYNANCCHSVQTKCDTESI
jgi:Xaa-Pro aminopeptidase